MLSPVADVQELPTFTAGEVMSVIVHQLNYEITAKDLDGFSEVYFDALLTRFHPLEAAVAGLFYLAALIIFLLTRDIGATLPFLIVGSTMAGMVTSSAHLKFRRRYKQRVVHAAKQGLLGNRTLLISQDGVRDEGQLNSASWKWAAFDKIQHLNQTVVFYAAGYPVVIVPRRAFANWESRKNFVQSAQDLHAHAITNPPAEQLVTAA